LIKRKKKKGFTQFVMMFFFVEKMTDEYGEHVTRQKKVFVGFLFYFIYLV
jgi:hypothetical protein